MPLRFAPARHRNPSSAVVLRNQSGTRVLSAANDNGFVAADDTLLVDALRHFGTYGLRSAKAAAHLAKAARAQNNQPAYDRWLAVCRMLDARLARELERDTAGAS